MKMYKMIIYNQFNCRRMDIIFSSISFTNISSSVVNLFLFNMCHNSSFVIGQFSFLIGHYNALVT